MDPGDPRALLRLGARGIDMSRSISWRWAKGQDTDTHPSLQFDPWRLGSQSLRVLRNWIDPQQTSWGHTSPSRPMTSLPEDRGPILFRALMDKMIRAEQATATYQAYRASFAT